MNRRTLRFVPLALAGALALTACGEAASGDQDGSSAGRIQVVTSTTVYADLVSRIGGEHVAVSAIIDSLSQDPHSYEATSRDKLALSKAGLVVSNGAGYDAFMDVMSVDLKLDEANVITAVDTSPVAHDDGPSGDESHDDHQDHGHEGHSHSGYNEHIWYDVESMRLLGDEITTRLSTLRPEFAESFTLNSAALAQDLQGLESRVVGLRGSLESRHFAMTEPVPFHLLDAAGMVDATPEGLSESIEGGGEVSPQAYQEMNTLMSNGAIDMLAYNTQTESPQTKRIRDQAERAGVDVVDFTETLPANGDYVSWMSGNIRSLEKLAK
ncbi:MAG: zinc ABC transporter substrate-binding protein [Micrococcaceae bacterium]|nr:zinc ABC transporter substrate-binding protein [Micrococcaceae bacterium]